MSESNNVKFVEAGGKWLWKRYNEEGSVISRSELFNTEREAREDYEINGGPSRETDSVDSGVGEATIPTAPEQTQEAAPEAGAESTVGTATGEENKPAEDNTAGSATL